MIATAKATGRATSCAASRTTCATGREGASARRRTMFSIITTAPSTKRPKSMAPRLMRFPEMPVKYMAVMAASIESGGKMFRPMALTVMFALVASLVLTLTVMPMLASFFLHKPVAERDSRIIGVARRGYAPVLARTMRHPAITILVATMMLGSALAIGSNLGADFLPRLEEGALTVTTTKLPGISLESAIATQTMVEKALKKFPEVQTVATLGGSSEIPTDPMGVEQSDTFIILKPKSEWRTAQTEAGLIEAYKQALDEGVPGITQSWAAPIEVRMGDLLQGVMAALAIVIHGTDTATLHDLG